MRQETFSSFTFCWLPYKSDRTQISSSIHALWVLDAVYNMKYLCGNIIMARILLAMAMRHKGFPICATRWEVVFFSGARGPVNYELIKRVTSRLCWQWLCLKNALSVKDNGRWFDSVRGKDETIVYSVWRKNHLSVQVRMSPRHWTGTCHSKWSG